MAFILTFLGKGGVGKTTIAIASAKKYAQEGKRVLLVTQDYSSAFASQLGTEIESGIQTISSNLSVIRLKPTQLLTDSWDEVKKQERKYLRSPILNNIFAEELAIIPGMDEALALNYLREQDQTGDYDVIIYDGNSSLDVLRMFGIPDTLSWYIRRVRNLLENSDIVKTLSPFIQPVTSAILNVSWSGNDLASQPTNQANQMLDNGIKAISNPERVAAFLVTNSETETIASAKYCWGSAQQVGLTIGGVLSLNPDETTINLVDEFAPLSITNLNSKENDHWEELINSLPDFQIQATQAPHPLIVDTNNREVKVHLPGFKKKEVKLTQS